MDKDNARKIILNAVSTSEPLWRTYGVPWDEIDQYYIRRGYEQGGFECWIFTEALNNECIYSIESLGKIMDNYSGALPYKREYAGSLESEFYNEMKQGKYGKEGQKFVNAITNFQGKPGAFFWRLIWQMLVACNYLKNKYNSSFSFYIKKKYADYNGLSEISNEDFSEISLPDWENFRMKTKPWNELYGVGENVFDFLMRDIIGFKFVENSYKLDLSNKHFLMVTGIFDHEPQEREEVIDFINGLELDYTLKEINKGIFAYCSMAEKDKYGFCRSIGKCRECNVFDICEKKL